MARGTVTPTLLVLNGGTVMAAGTINPANGHVLVVADGLLRRTMLEVVNVGTVAGTLLLTNGNYPPAYLGFAGTESGSGTTSITVPASGTAMVVLEGAKFVQADGQSVFLDFAPSTMSGNIYAYEWPQAL